MINQNTELTEFVQLCGFKRYPNEACGLIYSKNGKPGFVECKNVSLEPKHRFLIDPDEYLKITREHGPIVGCWHTHCNMPAVPSIADKQGCKNTQVPWFIGSVYGDEHPRRFEGLTLIDGVENYKTPLIGRVYVFGIFDCFSLMRDYYKENLNIELPELPRTEKIWESEENYFEHQAQQHFGFIRMPPNTEPVPGDLFFIQTGLFGADHIAIYVGEDKILHQMRNRLSRKDIYGGSYWQEHTTSHWRHRARC